VVAGVIERLRLVAAVLVLVYRNPVLRAKMVVRLMFCPAGDIGFPVVQYRRPAAGSPWVWASAG